MISNRMKKRFSRIVAGLVSAAMTLTMVPDVWLPVYADSVRNEIVSSNVSGKNIQEYKGNRYQLINENMTWTEAKTYCEKIGGHLATVTDESEQEFLTSLTIENGSNKNYWLGGYRDNSYSEWKWITGESFIYSNWDSGEPNYAFENYLHFYGDNSVSKAGAWNNFSDISNGYAWTSPISNYFICEWEGNVQNSIGRISEYTVFSSNQNEDLTLNGWKSNFTGGIYSGRNFVCNLSELYLDGKADAVGNVTANGWKINIPEKNENIEAIAMPALEESILAKAGDYTYYSESPSFIQDTNIINGSIMVSGDVTISGTNFEGDCYIIADKDITYNVNNLNTTGRLVLYSRNGNITVNGTNINIDGIMYAPKGKVSFNSNETTVNGRIWADTVNFSGSIFNIKGSDSDLDLIGDVSKNGITKTYTTNEDFSDGTLDGVRLTVPNQLILAEKTEENNEPVQKIFGDADSGNGVKLSYSADKNFVSQNGETVSITYGLSGFGEIQNEENAIDLVILIDESGSMIGERMNNAKDASKKVVAQMKPGDRCAIMGFSTIIHTTQTFTSDKEKLNTAIDKITYTGGTDIGKGLKNAIELFNDDSRQKYIMLISDGEDNSASSAMAATAGEKGIRILAMMVGTGSLQMQTIAINSNGIYKNAPTAEDIGKIMKYFASEVFNTAGRNTTFKTTVKDKNYIDLNAVTPKPDNIIENEDGSITLEWTYDRISINETENITLPVYAKSETGFADLIYDTSCVYYDKNGKPNVIYADDVSIPVSEYVSDGKWTAVFDSDQADTKWSGIYWNGIRYGDGQIRVSAAVSDDGSVFGEAVPVSNYGSVDLTGRYIRLNVDMSVSSDGKTPELFDITVTSENIPEQENSAPVAAIYTKLAAKVNVPVNMRGVVSDDCLRSDALSFEWSCADGNAVFADKNSLVTSAVFSSEGEHEIKLAVNDGEKITYASVTVNVVPADKYDDIDPAKG